VLPHRVRTVLAAAVAIGGGLLVLPAQARAGTADPPALLLVGQSTTVIPAAFDNPAPFSITVKVVGSAPAGGELGLTVYGKFTTRSAFDQSLGSPPTGNPMHVVAPQPLSGLRSANGGLQISTTVIPGGTPAGTDTIGLSRCVAGNGSCSGVYPAEVQLFSSDGVVVAHLTTYLTYAEQKSANSLVFSWVVPIGGPVDIRPTGPLPRAIAPLSPARIAALAQLTDTLADNLGVQVSVAPSPATVQRLEMSGSRNARVVLSDLKAIAGAGPGRLVAQPYVPVSLSSLSEAGIDEEIKGQVQGAEGIMTQALAGVAASDQPSFGTWVEDGPVNPAVAGGLADVGAKGIVVPDTDLAPASEQSHATWSQPFLLTLGRASVPAAVSDSELSAHFTAERRDPVLAANQLLAELAMIHFELPDSSEVRGVIAIPPSDWDPDPQFVTTLVSGLNNNPVVATATLTSFFNTVPKGGNEAPSTRHLAGTANPQRISSSEAAAIVTARKQINGFTAAVGASVVTNQLEGLLLSSESSQLSTEAQRSGIATFERHLDSELSGIKVVPSTVTLTARTASIPITILSSADFALKATLILSSPKLQFPGGATRTVDIDHPTNSTQIEVRARTTGDLPLKFELTSPGRGLVITEGQLTVRSTATSIVGIVLTLVAAIVLLGWWARTWQRGRRQRRPRPARGARS
jgi:hypothetical protein